MNISFQGNPKIQTMQPVPADLSPRATGGEKTAVPALVVTEGGAPLESVGISPAEFDKALVRDDRVGNLVNRALSDVPTKVIDKAIEKLLESDMAAKKTIIDNLKPSEREKEDQKAGVERAEKKRELKAAADKSTAKRLGEANADEKGTIERRRELENLADRLLADLAQSVTRPV